MEPWIQLLHLMLFFILNFIPQTQATNNFGLLYGSLRTFQAHACDNEELSLNCTPNTVISINYVEYGRDVNRGDLCPGPSTYDAEKCIVTEAIEVIRKRCQGQRVCRLLMAPHLLTFDPCPGLRKYAEVAYKCRPDHFLNTVACEGEMMDLNCPNGQGLTIYSAIFGTTEKEVPECRQPEGLETTDCQASYSNEIVMRLCNGKQKCTVLANSETLGISDCMGRKHLKVTYNCVHMNVMKPFPDEKVLEESILTTSFPAWAVALDSNSRPPLRSRNIGRTPTPSIPLRSEMQSDEVPLDGSKDNHLQGDQKLVGFMSQWMSAHKYMQGNKDRLILYVTLSVSVGLLAFVTVLAARCLLTRIKYRRKSTVQVVAIADDQFFSDSDLDHYEPPEGELPPPPLLEYTASMRRHSSNTQPRAPVSPGDELNHYFS